jgi:hypothetical protein
MERSTSSEGAKETQLACRDIPSEEHLKVCHPEEPFSWRRRISAILPKAELLPTRPLRTINGASSFRNLRASTGCHLARKRRAEGPHESRHQKCSKQAKNNS